MCTPATTIAILEHAGECTLCPLQHLYHTAEHPPIGTPVRMCDASSAFVLF